VARFRTILVATDFSEDANAALTAATDLAAALAARVHLLHVYPHVVDLFHTFGLDLPPPPVPEIRRSAAVRLDQDLKRIRDAGVEGEWHLREGAAAPEIVGAAEELGADLLVMGTRGRGGVPHAMTGSVAERVVRLAACPVLTLKAGAQHDPGTAVS
jgi:nucleotide-binding universal stress UspA family protein